MKNVLRIHLLSFLIICAAIYGLREFAFQKYDPTGRWHQLQTYKGVDLFFGIGDVALPRDINSDPSVISNKAGEISFDSAIISSALTQNVEVWTWLPKSVGLAISAIDRKEGLRYETEILNGVNYWNESLNKHKVFQVELDSEYFKQTGMREIYAISLFQSVENSSIDDKKNNIRLGITQQIKSIFEKTISRSEKVTAVGIPALSAAYHTTDADQFLSYQKSWSSIFEGIERTNDFGGVSSVYFVAWEGLKRDPTHLEHAIESFFNSYNDFNKSMLFPLALVSLISLILGVYAFDKASILKSRGHSIFLMVPATFSLFGLFGSPIIPTDIYAHFSSNYYVTSILIALGCYLWPMIISKSTSKEPEVA